MNKDIQVRTDLNMDEGNIISGLHRNEFYMAYQAQVDASGGRLLGFESLMRWNSKIFGSVSPDKFITLAEQGDAINHIWKFLLKAIANDRGRLDGLYSPSLHISLNLSAKQLPQQGFAASFRDWLQESNIDGSQIHIEITESGLLSDSPVVSENLFLLGEMGIMLWLDDFGTGYSSLKHIRDLPIAGLKIDKSFVDNLVENLDDFRIVSAIIAMANSLSLKTVAEGVETQDQAQVLSQLGCDILQGYLIGRPESLNTATEPWAQQAGAAPTHGK